MSAQAAQARTLPRRHGSLRSPGRGRRPAIRGRAQRGGDRGHRVLRRRGSDRARRAPTRGLHRRPADGGSRRGGRLSPTSRRAGRRTSTWTCARPCTPSTPAPSGTRRSTVRRPRIRWCSTTRSCVTPYRTADGRWVMASGVYPHLAAKWCRFLDVPPDAARVAAAIATWDAVRARGDGERHGPADLRRAHPSRVAGPRAGSAAGQPAGHRPRAHRRRSGAGLRSGRATVRRHPRRCRSPTRSPVPPWVGPWPSTERTCSARPAPTTTSTSSSTPRPTSAPGAPTSTSTVPRAGPRSSPAGRRRRRGQQPPLGALGASRRSSRRQLAEATPASCTSRSTATARAVRGPAAGGFDMNGSAASGLMTIEGTEAEPRLPVTVAHQRLHHRLHGRHRRHRRPGQARHRGRLVARHRQPDEDRDVVRLARPRRLRPSPAVTRSTACASPHPTTPPAPSGDVHMLAPPVRFSATAPGWPTPLLVPRGSGRASGRGRPAGPR